MRRLSVLVPFALALAASVARAEEPHPAMTAAARAEEARPGRTEETHPGRAEEAHARGEESHAAPFKKICLPASETREEIKKSHLREPFAVLKLAAQHFKAEALSARLCRIDDEFIYEVVLLHRDGKFFHGHVSATTGKIVEMRRVPASAPKASVADH